MSGSMPMFAPGTRFGHYELMARLGAGGMAEVYRARDLTLGRQVAIKVLPANVLVNRNQEARFRQEATTVSSINHPNIVTIFEIGTIDEVLYIAMELVEGKTLRQLLIGGALPIATVLDVGAQVADGLAKAHAAQIVHRDLKPENIMVTDDGLVKILDFGVAKVGDSTPNIDDLATGSFFATRPGMVVGTAAYMSCEQARGHAVDFRSDQFVLGLVLYELATGRHPFRRASAVQTMSAIIDATHDPLLSAAPSAPPQLAWIVDRCLSKNPEHRYGSTRDLARDLQHLAGYHSGSGTVPIVLAPPKPKPRAATRRAIDSIAVLPFVNASRDADTDYLTEGITESIINSLSQVPKLKVIARSTMFRYRDRADDAQAVAAELQVRGVVTGRVQIRGDQLLVSAELVDAARGSQVWGGQYNCKFADVFSIPQEVATELTSALRVRLTGAQRKRIGQPQSQSGEAYQLYLRGRFAWNKRTPDEIKRGMDYFERATHADPTFALAYAGLADCYCVLGAGEFAMFPPRQMMPKAKAAATRALELDDTRAETHAAVGSVSFWYDWDWAAAEREFVRAIELNPGYSVAHGWYAEFLSAMGRFDQAIAEARRAADLDPLSIATMWTLARVMNLSGDQLGAIAEMKRSLEIEPASIRPYFIMGWAYYKIGQVEEAYEALKATIAIGGDNPFKKGFLGHIYAVSGRVDDARQLLNELLELAKTRFVSAFYIAMVYSGLGELDSAFEYMDRAFEERSSYLAYAGVTPFLDGLKGDPRFNLLLQRLGLPAALRAPDHMPDRLQP
jgi:serine/threonine-protein kinase